MTADPSACVDVDVEILRNSTGESLTYKMPSWLEEDGEPSTFIFSDGNWSCDCNRLLDWKRNGGDATGLPDDDVRTCFGGEGGTGMFSLRVSYGSHDLRRRSLHDSR